MIDKGMDNDKGVLQGLIDQANKRIAEIESGENTLDADSNAITRNSKWTSTSSTNR